MLRIVVLSSVGLVLMILILCICICCIKKKNDKMRKQEQSEVHNGGTYISTDESVQNVSQINARNAKGKSKKG